MTKFLGIAMTMFVMFVSSGCPDDTDDCPSGDECLCYGICDGGDADADSGTTDAEDDATTDESTACPTCPNVTGTWSLWYHYDSGETTYWFLTLEQTAGSDHISGDDRARSYSGRISPSGAIFLEVDSGGSPIVPSKTLTGNFTQHPPHMRGEWQDDPDHPFCREYPVSCGGGSWKADPYSP